MENNDISTILEKYSKYLSHIRNFSKTTITDYTNSLKMFFKFIKDYKDIEQIDLNTLINISSSDIYSFLIYLNMYRNNQARSRQKKLSAIKCFYNWLFNCNYEKCKNLENPAESIVIHLEKYKEAKCLTLKEAKKITNIFNLENDKMYIRDNTIISIFLNCGLRVSELVSLNISSINLKNKSILVFGKERIERNVPLNKNVENNLLRYLETEPIIKEHRLDKEYPLFINKNYKRISVESIERICRNAFNLAGLENKGYTVHSLRHTCATLLYLYSKADIVAIKEVLGHTCIEATQLYIHTDKKKIKNSFLSNPIGTIKIKRRKEENNMEYYYNEINKKDEKDFDTDTIRENQLTALDGEYDLLLQALEYYIETHKRVYSNIDSYNPLGKKLRLDLLQNLYNKILRQYNESVKRNPVIHIENAKYDLYDRIDRRTYYKTKKYYKNRK